MGQHFPQIILFNLHTRRGWLLSLRVTRAGNGGSERESDLPEVLQLLSKLCFQPVFILV